MRSAMLPRLGSISLRSVVSAIGLTAAITFGLFAPLAYGTSEYFELAHDLSVKARLSAERVAKYVSSHQKSWQYDDCSDQIRTGSRSDRVINSCLPNVRIDRAPRLATTSKAKNQSNKSFSIICHFSKFLNDHFSFEPAIRPEELTDK